MAAAKPKITLICNHCARPFDVKPSLEFKAKYCSKSCKDDSKKNKIPRVCENCQVTFYVWPSAAHEGAAKYCSVACRMPRPMADRFWEKVAIIDDDTSCWLWTAATDDGGYGILNVEGVATRATHIAWELANGPLPPGLWTLHHCDVRACVRNDGPRSHLYAGTHADNVRDRSTRHRTASGMANGSNTHPEVHLKRFPLPVYAEIRALHATGLWSYAQIGKQYGVEAPTIWYIVKKQKHIP